jgi:predicted ATP-grasp superfamily ATP-dependent carboligase
LLKIFSDIGRRLGRPTIALPTDDEAAGFVAEHAHELASWFIFPEIPRDLPRRLASKRGLHDVCDQLGIPIPRALFPTSLADVLVFAGNAMFPVVAKNVDEVTPSQVTIASRRDAADPSRGGIKATRHTSTEMPHLATLLYEWTEQLTLPPDSQAGS